MEWGTVIALVIAVPFLLFPVALIWYITGGGIYQAIRRAREKSTQTLENLACSVDADCAPGYACVNGYCVPAPS
jgi:hypothetical protein